MGFLSCGYLVVKTSNSLNSENFICSSYAGFTFKRTIHKTDNLYIILREIEMPRVADLSFLLNVFDAVPEAADVLSENPAVV